MSRHSAAHYFLEGLVDLGVDYIFANLGTDHVSLIEEIARWDREGRKHPEVILCPHEIVAVHMAGGYALATGRGQAVFVHVDAGTANACMAIQNLFRYRLPVMLFAGRAPYTLHGELPGSRETYVNFVQDPFDIASIVRPYVKWEYSLPSGTVVTEASARAVWRRAHRRHRAGAGRCDRAGIDGGGKPGRTDGLSWPQAASRRRAGPAGAELRHPGRRIQLDRPQYLAGLALLRRLRSPAPVGTSRSRPAAGFGCAVHSAVCQACRRHQMDSDRHRSLEVRFSDVGISDRHAYSRRLRHRAAAGTRCGGVARRRRLAPPCGRTNCK